MKIPLKIVITSLLFIGMNVFQLYGDEIDEKAGQSMADNDAMRLPFSQKGNFEIGGVAGMPSGINGRWWIANIFGIDFTIGSTIRRDFIVSLDLLLEHATLYRSRDLHLRFF
jgi:hypothetical protein